MQLIKIKSYIHKCLLLIMFFSVLKLQAQDKKINIFVWEIQANEKDLVAFSQSLTNEFEAIISKVPQLNLLERRKFATIEAQLRNEKAIAGYDLDQITIDGLKRKGAEQIVLGSVFLNQISEQYIFEFSITNLETTDKKMEILIFEKNEFTDSKRRFDKLEKKIVNMFLEDKQFIEDIDFGLSAFSERKFDLSFFLLNKYSENKNLSSDVLYALGYMYYEGKGIQINLRKAKYYFESASKFGDKFAQNYLGLMHLRGEYEGHSSNFQEAMRLFKLSSEKINGVADTNIGEMYYRGLGVNQNICEAEKWFEKATLKENYNAFFFTALINLEGGCKGKNAKKAYDNFLKALNDNNEANYYLGILLFSGGEGLKKNYSESHNYLVQYIENNRTLKNSPNYFNALSTLGLMYAEGLGVEKNIYNAYHYIYKAADNGNIPLAQFNLGIFYTKIYPSQENTNEAIRWFKKASANGWEDAKKALREMGISD